MENDLKVLYISPDGNDSNTGINNNNDSNGSLATPHAALNAAREIRSTGYKGKIILCFRGGTYELSKALQIEPLDSGTSEGPLEFISYEGEKALFSAGLTLTGFQEKEGLFTIHLAKFRNGNKYFRQLFNGVKRLTRSRLPADGEYFLMTGAVPESEEAQSHMRSEGKKLIIKTRQSGELFIVQSGVSRNRPSMLTAAKGRDGTMVKLTSGEENVIDLSPFKDAAYWMVLMGKDVSSQTLGELEVRNGEVAITVNQFNDPHSFKYKKGDLKLYHNFKDAEIVSLNRWNTTRLPLEDINETKELLRVGGVGFKDIHEGKRYFIENVKEGLLESGSWYLDKNNETLFYKPFKGEKASELELTASNLVELIQFKGDPENNEFVEHIHFKNISFRYGDWSMGPNGCASGQAAIHANGLISGKGARYIEMDNCEISNCGGYGIKLLKSCSFNKITRTEMFDLGAGGVHLGSPDFKYNDGYDSSDNVISDCHVHRMGRVHRGACGLLLMHGSRNRIAHNEIHDHYYTGISIGWNWDASPTNCRDNVIEYNHIYDLLKKTLSDSGGIYTVGISPGTVIRNNVIHDVWPFHGAGRGIYLDEFSVGILVENNIVYNTFSPGMRCQTGTYGNIIMNNIFAQGTKETLGFDTILPNTFILNIVYWEEGKLHGQDEWKNLNSIFERNVYWNPNDVDPDFCGLKFEDWQNLRPEKHNFLLPERMDPNSIYADPKFKDPSSGNFELAPDSPAFDLGFKPIDRSKVGLRRP